MNDLALLSPADAARLLGLSADMVRVLARRGRLRPVARSVGGARLFSRADVEWLAAERRGEAPHDHAVVFHPEGGFSAEAVADFLLPALRGAGVAVVIATPAHRRAIRARLASEGIDVAAASRAGRLVLLDAAATLARCSGRGRPSPSRFGDVVGAVLERAEALAPRGHPRLFGEMVDLLSRRGDHAGALALERLWNDLARRRSFSLLCGYSPAAFPRAEHGGAFERTCAEHARVLANGGRGGPADAPAVRARLEQKARALDAEVARRKRAEDELRRVRAQRDRAVAALEKVTGRRVGRRRATGEAAAE